ncbi:tryptophanase [Natronorarus salvus]|uniref:tryptophanase n=1 Tax=Natronorarus salvus TaxID=3117733 RepID=UPI002F26D304
MVQYRSAMAAPIDLLPRDDRRARLREAGYNLFDLAAEDVFVDLLTDSGTGAMSTDQWAALMTGDEAYAGSRSFARLEDAVSEVMGFEHVLPTHQGRGAENVLYGHLCSDGDIVINNTHFDTTRAHVAANGATPIDCPVEEAADLDTDTSFKGNLDVEAARGAATAAGRERVAAVVLTITNNSMAGQPVSVENTRAARDLADDLDVPLVVDACRFAENAHFVREREPGFAEASVAASAREQLSYADCVVMSGKKEGLSNVGGFLALRDPELAEALKPRLILYEGFPTYGGMAGRDMAAMAVGLREAVDGGRVRSRVAQVRALGDRLRERGVPIYEPVGGHAVYVDAGATLPHLDPSTFPGQALACAAYLAGGVRGVELGSLAFPEADRPELLRLALPRRTYHDEHLDHVAETFAAVFDRREEVGGLELVTDPDPPELRHFSAELRPLEASVLGD